MKHFLILCLYVCLVHFSFGQEKQSIINQRIEYVLEQSGNEEIDASYLTDILNQYYNSPLNLNEADKEALSALNLLSEFQINAFFAHRKVHGKLMSIYELQVIPFWDLQTIQLILPFVVVDDKLSNPKLSVKQILKYGTSETYMRFQTGLEQKAGYRSTLDTLGQAVKYYQGNAHKYYLKSRFTYRNNLSIGLAAEKDAGETFGGKYNPYGFDFYTAHLYVSAGKYLKAVALGDFHVQIGQGLNCWSGFGMGKSVDGMTVKKATVLLRPNTSVDEQRFLRGAGVHLNYKAWQMLLFASYKKVDGAISIDSNDLNTPFSAMVYDDGFHRTLNEINRKNKLKELISGVYLKYDQNNLSFGLASVYQQYNQALGISNDLYQSNDFKGKYIYSNSIDFSYQWRNILLFGESSFALQDDENKNRIKSAHLYGFMIALNKHVNTSLVYRNYAPGYHTFYNQALKESYQNQNEKGFLLNFSAQLPFHLKYNFQLDLFEFPWLKYQVNNGSKGYELMQQLSYKPNKKLELYLRYRMQQKEKNTRADEKTIVYLEPILQHNIRLHLQYQISEFFQLRSRVEYTLVKRPSNSDEKGILLFQDFIYKPKKWPFDVTLRYLFFDTDSYDSRIYAYESNMPTVYSVPSFYGQGSKFYLMINYTFLKHFDLWLRYGMTRYQKVSQISSGAEAIDGSLRSDISLQIRMRF
jgi:hypothetical protein